MPTFQEKLDAITKARQKNAAAEDSLYVEKLAVQRSLGNIPAADYRQKLQTKTLALNVARQELSASVEALHAESHRTLAAQMNGQMPLLLLPVRLETRFGKAPDGKSQLWIRIYPDDIAIRRHEPLLTAEEQVAAEQYWKDLRRTMLNDANETPRRDAWQALADRFGVQRALWAARKTRPSNWSNRKLKENQLTFPQQSQLRTHGWTQAPRTQVMPDRFVAMIYKNGVITHEKAGNLIPDTLFIGPDPFDENNTLGKKDGQITFGPDVAWVADFQQAVQNGMGIVIDQPEQFFVNGKIQRLVVAGLLFSAAAGASGDMLADLLENHCYTPKGLGLLPQGAPTNNTEDGDSAFAKNDNWLEKGYYDEPDQPLFSANPGCDGQRLETRLGIRAGVLDRIAFAAIRDAEEAMAMNRALFPATLGYFSEIMMKAVFGRNTAWLLREFFLQHVSARGPLPALRVGDQPYGVLITSDLRKWKINFGDLFFERLTNVLLYFQQRWDDYANAKVRRVGQENADPATVLLDVLALQPGSASFRQRPGLMADYLRTTFKAAAVKTFTDAASASEKAVSGFLRPFGYVNEALSPLLAQLHFYGNNKTVPVPARNLVDSRPLSETEPLPPLEPGGKNYIGRLLAYQTVEALRKQEFGQQSAPNSLLYLLLRHALLHQTLYSACQYYYEQGEKGEKFPLTAFQKSFQNFDAESDLSHWEMLQGKPADANASKTGLKKPLGDAVLQGQEDPNEMIGKMKKALQTLENLPTACLERCLTEHLDLCSYRLDAWQTGLFSKRLDDIRQQSAAKTGLYLGAYGWVEDLKPDPKTTLPAAEVPDKLRPGGNAPVFSLKSNLGFIHAPSLHHAASGGLLLAGYAHHGKPGDPAGAFAVNLSSGRVRRALFILEGVRNGQSLSALLGYQFERALHDAGKSALIARMRALFPFRVRVVAQEGSQSAPAAEYFAPVADGLRIAEMPDASFVGNPAFVQRFPDVKDRELLKKIKDALENTLDAVKDLLMAESAYQLTQGNSDRASGVFNALQEGTAPPLPDVVETPRTQQLKIVNRVAVHFDETTPNDNDDKAWTAPFSPRAKCERGLNRWLARLLGDPKNVCCIVSQLEKDDTVVKPLAVTLDKLNIQPIDFVYLTDGKNDGGATELEARVATFYREKQKTPPTAGVKIDFSRTDGKPGMRSFAQLLVLAASLRRLVTAARPAHALDYLPDEQQESAADQSSARKIDANELKSRVQDLYKMLENEFNVISAKAPNDALPKNDTNPATFRRLFELYETDGLSPARFEALGLTDTARSALYAFRQKTAAFGTPNAWPDNLNIVAGTSDPDFLTQAAGVWLTARKNLNNAKKQLDAAAAPGTKPAEQVSLLVAAGKALLGDDFVIIPKFTYANPGDIAQANAERGSLLQYFATKYAVSGTAIAEEWLQGAARVRVAVGRLDRVRTAADLLGRPAPEFRPIQLPYRPNDSWLAAEFPENLLKERHSALSVMICGNTAFDTGKKQGALLLDDWTESIPAGEESTGVAFHYNQPDATPPQTLLLALMPEDKPNWNWDALVGILDDTLGRAKRRAVEPAHFANDRVLSSLLPALVADFSLSEANISLDYAVTNRDFLSAMKGKNLSLYEPFTKS